MKYFNEMERDFVLGDLEVFNEFDSSHFISNAKFALSNKAETVNVNLKFNYYTSMLEKAIESFSSIKLQKDTIKDFLQKFNTISSLDSSNTMTKDINIDEISVFKPQYLTQYVQLVNGGINDFINDKIDFATATKFMTGEYPIKVEKQIVKTNLPYGLTAKDIRKEAYLTDTLVKADTKFVKEKLIPFVTNYDKYKSELLVEANAVLNVINESELTVRASLNALNNVRTMENISTEKINLVNQLSYNAIRGIIDVISFVSYMMIHKLNVFSTNIITANKLYETVYNMYGGNVTESEESVIPTDEYSTGNEFIEGKVSAYAVLASNIYEYHSGMIDPNVISNNSDDTDENKVVYPVDIYNEITKAYDAISIGLDMIAKEGGEYLLVFDDLITKSGLQLGLQDRFREVIKAILDMSMYSTDANPVTPDPQMYSIILNEVKDYPDNMQIIATKCHDTFDKMILLQERFATNMNGEYKDIETINELKIFIKELRDQYVDMTNSISNNFMTRLKELGNTLTEMDSTVDADTAIDVTIPVETSSNIDFSESAFEIELANREAKFKNYFESLQMDYFAEKTKASRGLNVIFEADDAPASDTSDMTEIDPNTGEEIQNPPAEEPSETDTPSEQPAEQPSSDLSGLVNQFFEDVRTNIGNIISRNSKHNTEFINTNKDGLLNRSYSNVTIQVLPFSTPYDTIKSNMDSIVENINTIDDNFISGLSDKGAVYTKIMPFVKGVSVTDDTTDADTKKQILNFYIMNDVNTEPENQNISNSELKSFVESDAIPFCEGFYDVTLNDLSTFATNVEDALNSHVATSSDEKAKWIVDAVRFFTNVIAEVLQKKNNNYLEILKKLVVEPKNTGEKAKVSDGNDPENTPTEEQEPESDIDTSNMTEIDPNTGEEIPAE